MLLGICHNSPSVISCDPVFGIMPCATCHSFIDRRILQVNLENNKILIEGENVQEHPKD